jgi:hypothetical protein
LYLKTRDKKKQLRRNNLDAWAFKPRHVRLGLHFFFLLFKREDYLSSASFYLFLSKYADDALLTKVDNESSPSQIPDIIMVVGKLKL